MGFVANDEMISSLSCKYQLLKIFLTPYFRKNLRQKGDVLLAYCVAKLIRSGAGKAVAAESYLHDFCDIGISVSECSGEGLGNRKFKCVKLVFTPASGVSHSRKKPWVFTTNCVCRLSSWQSQVCAECSP